MEDTLLAIKNLLLQAIETCTDFDLLDLIYKMLIF